MDSGLFYRNGPPQLGFASCQYHPLVRLGSDHPLAVRDIEDGHPETLGVLRRKVLESVGVTNRGGNAVLALEEKLCQLPSKTATGTPVMT